MGRIRAERVVLATWPSALCRVGLFGCSQPIISNIISPKRGHSHTSNGCGHARRGGKCMLARGFSENHFSDYTLAPRCLQIQSSKIEWEKKKDKLPDFYSVTLRALGGPHQSKDALCPAGTRRPPTFTT